MDFDKYEGKTKELLDQVAAEKRVLDENVLNTLPELMEVAKATEDYNLQGYVHFHMADALFAFEIDYEQFRENLAKAVYCFQRGGEKELLARSFNFIAIDALNNGSFDVAYLYLMNALQTCEGLDNNYLLSIINNNIGQVFARMHSHEKAIKFVHRGNELQALCDKEDFYFYQNMINGYFSEGVLCAMMGDLEGAENAESVIAKIEAETDISTIPSVFIPISLLRLMISILRGDKEQSDYWSHDIVEKLHNAHRVYDFITDLEDLSHFLIEHDYLDTAREILDIIKNTVEATSVVQMQKIVSSMEISYYEKRGDTENVIAHLREQYHLSEQQQMERNRIYQYSIDLINIMNEHRRELEKVKLENEKLNTQVQTDPLTGIPNRLMLDDVIPEIFEAAKKESRAFAVSLMDIDRFKEYNDTYGHLAGDICLQKVAKAISDVSDRPGVHCARFGGDEFLMVYNDMSDEEILKIAGELSDKIYELDIEHSGMGENGRISLSQGICNCVPNESHRQEDYLNEADNALYAVKKYLNMPVKSESVRLVHM